MPYRVFSLEEVAHYLHLPRADIERLAKREEVPFEKRGDRLVFRKIDIDTWASQRILGLQGGRLATYHKKSTGDVAYLVAGEALMPALIHPGFVHAALPARTRASALRELCAFATRTGRVADSKALLETVEAREQLCSTGVSGGLALPHPRYPDPDLIESPFIVVGRTVQGIPFGAPDGRPTDLFFLIGCPDDRLHLHVLARVCLMAQNTELLSRLRSSPAPEEMRDIVIEAEAEALAERARTKA